jgi:hypothetical protein
MEDNEKEVEETTEKNDEELEETEAEEVDEETNEEDEDDSDVPSLEDYEALQKKLKTIEAQKEHWRKKAQTSRPEKKGEELKKSNEKDVDFEELMDIRFLKRDGYTEEDIEKLKIIKAGYASNGKSVSLIDAVNDELFKSFVEKKKLQEKKEKAQLSPSGKPLSSSQKEMSPEEFEKFRQSKSKEFLRNMGFGS